MSDPIETFREVAASYSRCVWLDGGGAREWSGRRSIIGWCEDADPSLTYSRATGLVTLHRDGDSQVVGADPFEVLEQQMAAGEQWFGYFGYAARADLPARPDGSGMPDAVWMRPSRVRMFDHPPAPDPLPPAPLAPDFLAPGPLVTSCSGDYPPRCNGAPDDVTGRDKELAEAAEAAEEPPREYAEAFARVQERLHAGDSYEVNLTHRLQQSVRADPAEVYLRLRALNPAPYAGFLQHDVPGAPGWLLSSSPERYALIDRDRRLVTKPIKGTTPRRADPQEDEQAKHRLATHAKYRAENLMIVDLLRNDLSMVCEPGSVTVPELMAVESYRSVHQLVSTVTGRLREDVSSVGALRALFPAGSMTGAPKLRTMEIIEAVEATPRGAYAGAFGWISGDGPADLGVVIRTLTTAGPDQPWVLGTGGGITVQSEVADEFAETRWKARNLQSALVFFAEQDTRGEADERQ